MAVNKNFVVKNGLEVNTNLLVADLDTQTVGIGTTIAPHELHVVGGIGVTNLNVTGVATIANLRIGGISTFVGFTTFLNDINVGGASTFTGLVDINGGGQANTFKVEDLTDNRVVIVGSGGELEDDGNFTFTGNQLTLGVGATVGGGLTASSVMVEDLTNNRVVIAGTNGELEDDANFTFDGSQLILGVGATVGGGLTVAGVTDLNSTLDVSGNVSLGSSLDVTGLTELGDVNVSAGSTFGGLVDINAGGQANTFKVEDLTDNRVVLAGTGGELEDSGNLTFDGTQLVVTGVATVSGAMTAGSFSVGNNQVISSARQLQNIASLDSTTTATIESAIANAPNTFTDLQITGIATFKNDVEFHGANGITSSFFDQSANALKFVDDAKALFGTGDDLEIYHDGSNSYIKDAGTGSLHIQGRNLVLEDIDGENYLAAYLNGQVALYFDNALKLETANDGVKITGGVNVSGLSTFSNNVSIADKIIHTGDTDTAIRFPGADTFTVETGGSEAIRVDSTQRVFVGATAQANAGIGQKLYVAQSAGDSIANIRYGDNANASYFLLGKSRSTSVNGYAVLQDNDEIGRIQWVGSDNSDLANFAASIGCFVDGSPGTDDMPSRLVFKTRGDGANSETERLRITSDGDVEFKGNNGITSMTFDRSSNSLDFVDNAKAQFGTGDDLQIYHDGSNSVIKDNGTGKLILDTDGASIEFQKQGLETIATFNSDGAVELYHDNTKKFETGSDGVIATGIITATGGFDLGIHSAGTSVVSGPVKILNFVGSGNTFAYNASTDTIDISIAGGSGGGGGSGVTETDTTVSTVNPTGVGSFATASFRSASVIAQINQLNTDFQVGRYLMIHDGTTVTVVEESAVSTGSTMLGSFTGVIDGSNVELRVTLASAGVSTVTTKIDTVTV